MINLSKALLESRKHSRNFIDKYRPNIYIKFIKLFGNCLLISNIVFIDAEWSSFSCIISFIDDTSYDFPWFDNIIPIISHCMFF